MNCPYVMRRCKECGEVKFLFKFKKHKGSKYGFEKRCKECVSEYHKQHYQDNKEKISEYHKQHYQDNKEKISEYRKQYRQDNKEKISERNKQYYQDNKEKISEREKQYYQDNKEKILERNKQYRQDNKEEISEYRKQYYQDNKEKEKQYYQDNKEEILERNKQYYQDNKEEILEQRKQYRLTPQGQVVEFNKSNRRRSKLKNQGHGISKEQWLEMMNFFEWKCAYSNMSLSKKSIRSIDHIVALNNGGLNEIWNCVPMYGPYNSSKHTSDMLEWYQQQEFYSIERLQKIYEWQEYAYNKWHINMCKEG